MENQSEDRGKQLVPAQEVKTEANGGGFTKGLVMCPIPAYLQEWTNDHISSRVEVLEQQEKKLGKERKYEELSSNELLRLLAERDQTIAELRATMAKKEPSETLSSILLSDLPEAQRAVLQSILNLHDGDNAFAETERLIGTLEGQPMTQAFANSFKAVLQTKCWGVVCETCKAPSTISWRRDVRYESKGYAQFTHTGPSSHGCITKVRIFNLVQKIDRRRKA